MPQLWKLIAQAECDFYRFAYMTVAQAHISLMRRLPSPFIKEVGLSFWNFLIKGGSDFFHKKGVVGTIESGCLLKRGITYFHITHFLGLNSETKIALQKKALHSKETLGFVKCFSEFSKRIYETCDCNFFNFVIIIVAVTFSIVQFILFLHSASNN